MWKGKYFILITQKQYKDEFIKLSNLTLKSAKSFSYAIIKFSVKIRLTQCIIKLIQSNFIYQIIKLYLQQYLLEKDEIAYFYFVWHYDTKTIGNQFCEYHKLSNQLS